MSNTNLDTVRPTPLEIAGVNWESANNTNQGGWYCRDEDLVRKAIRKMWEIPINIFDLYEYKKGHTPNWEVQSWQMKVDIPILPESKADLDDIVIPFWYGLKPEKKTRWQRLVGWFKS